MALVDERLDVVLDVVDVAVDDAVTLDLLDLVDVSAFVCKGRVAVNLVDAAPYFIC